MYMHVCTVYHKITSVCMSERLLIFHQEKVFSSWGEQKVLVFALVGIALVGARVLMALNLAVSSGTVNSLLLYANMVKLNENMFFLTQQ